MSAVAPIVKAVVVASYIAHAFHFPSIAIFTIDIGLTAAGVLVSAGLIAAANTGTAPVSPVGGVSAAGFANTAICLTSTRVGAFGVTVATLNLPAIAVTITIAIALGGGWNRRQGNG